MANYFAKIWLQWLIRQQEGSLQKGIDPSPIKSLLFVELTKFGDVVVMLPALQSFHEAYPEASITVAVQPQWGGILTALPFPVNILPLENTQSAKGFLKSISKIKEKQYNLAISVSPGVRNGILTLSTNSKAKIGYFEVLDSVTPFLHSTAVRGFGIDLKKNEIYGHENISLRAKKICSALGLTWNEKSTFAIPDSLREKVRKQLNLNQASTEKQLVILHPFAGWEYREWKLSNFLSVARELSGVKEIQVVIIGIQNELDRMRKDQGLPAGVILFESGNIPELLALYSMSALYIGNDSGPLHLASTAGVPCVGLFGPASPDLTAPISERNIYCYHRVECSPCNQLVCVRPEHPCMELITQDEALNAAHKLLRLPVNAS